MKHLITFLLTLTFLASYSQEPSQIPNAESIDSLKTKVMKLMDFFESYDNGSPESLKKAKYNDAIDEISDGTATQKDKNDAYQIIDAYIKGDKALEKDKPQKRDNDQSFDDAIKNSDEVKNAQTYLNQQKDMFLQMSYAEFESYILSINPGLGKKEIKTAYNEMHKTDGKQVRITSKDGEMTETQLQIWAYETMQNPKSCADFRKAIHILKIEVPESEIQKACQKIQ